MKATPALALEVSQSTVTFEKYGTYVEGDLGVYVVAGGRPVEVRARRSSYSKPIVAKLVRPGRDATLPAPADFSGLKKFSRVTIADHTGKVVATLTSSFCPNFYQPVRRTPTAPATSPYPQGCYANPYSLGAVWGIQAGWATPLVGDGYSGSVVFRNLALGSYTATVSIAPAYRKPLSLTAAEAQVKVKVVVVKGGGGCADVAAGCSASAQARTLTTEHASTTPSSSGQVAALAASHALGGRASRPSGPLPDLRALPAWGIGVVSGRYLDFSATVWNAGPGRLVVDGFRKKNNPNRMAAYQYFFSASGKQKGYARVGGMEWDPRKGHQHWHFQNFATYQLLDAKKKFVVRSQKEAFCLANTDAVDYTVKGANWAPQNTNLHTACGSRTSLGVREVLDAGSGDTYSQYLPGQSFDLKGLANGTYYIQVLANPAKVLYEKSTKNNSSLRKVVVTGTAGARKVTVAKVGLITELR